MHHTRSFFQRLGQGILLGLLLTSIAAPGLVLAQTPPPAPAPAPTPAPTTPAPTTPPTTPPATTPPASVPAYSEAPIPTASQEFRPIVPRPSVPIPGVRFTPAVEEDGLISIPYLAQYISGIYRLSVGLGAILAAIMIVYGGFRYMLAASLPDVKDGKEIITDAVVGLIVLLTSYLILKTINPALVEMSPIRVQRIREEAPYQQTGEFTGNPAATGFSSGSYSNGDTPSCGTSSGGAAARTQTIEGVQFQVLPLRGRYAQGDSPWGNISYGNNLIQNESQNPCHGDGRGGTGFHQPIVNGCTQTFKNGGCGVTAFAEIMAFYGVMQTNPGDANLVQNTKMWNGDQLVPLAQHPDGQGVITRLQARAQSHLFDPIDAARLTVAQGFAGSGGSAVTTRVPAMEGFTKDSFTDPARAAAEVRAGHPLVFYCHHCQLKQRSMADPDHRGGAHFMVIHGVSLDGQWFLVHDSGGGGTAGGKFISAQEIREGMQPNGTSHRVTLTAVVPSGSTPVRPCSNSADPGTGGGGNVSNAGDLNTRATVGGVTMTGFNYVPPSGGPGWDSASPSQLFYPERFGTAFRAGGARPRVHLYVFIHGLNSHGTPLSAAVADGDSWVSSIRGAMSQIAGSKNVLVAAPYYVNGDGRSYMNRFDLPGFITAALAAARERIPGFQDSDIEDIVVGGHSAATCLGPGAPLLRQALHGTINGKRVIGVVAYDGCMTDSNVNFTREGFATPSGVALLMNPDLRSLADGMGMASTGRPPVLARRRYALIRQSWELPRMNCPAYVQNKCPMETPPVEPDLPLYDQRRCNACYGKTVDGKQIISFETTYGHRASVLHMTKYAFGAFYGQ